MPQSQDARELLNKLRACTINVKPEERLLYTDPPIAWIDWHLTIHDALMTLQEYRLSAPAKKTVPMAMLRDCGHHYMDKGKLRKVAERYDFKVTED
jgi:predicted nucleic acid-binding protein